MDNFLHLNNKNLVFLLLKKKENEETRQRSKKVRQKVSSLTLDVCTPGLPPQDGGQDGRQ